MIEAPTLTLEINGRIYEADPDSSLSVGSSHGCDVHVDDGPDLWIRFRYAAGWTGVINTPGCTVRVDGHVVSPIGAEHRILVQIQDGRHVLCLRQGDRRLSVAASIEAYPRRKSPPHADTQRSVRRSQHAIPDGVRLGTKKRVIGRVGSNADIKIEGYDVAEAHATIRWNGSYAILRDLRGGTGTFVDGLPVIQCRILPGQEFVIVHSTLRLRGSGILVVGSIPQPPALVISNLTVKYPTNRTPTMENISLSLERGGLLAIVGPSGIGKSTLLAGLVGEAEIIRGSAYLENFQLGNHQGASPALVSLVPQQD